MNDDTKALQDLRESLNAIHALWTDRRYSLRQAQESADAAFRNFVTACPFPSPVMREHVQALHDKAAAIFRDRDDPSPTPSGIRPKNALHAYLLRQFDVAEAKERQRMKHGRTGTYQRDFKKPDGRNKKRP